MPTTSKRNRITVILGIAIVSFLVMTQIPPIAQDPAYHDFADKRAWLGIPNFGDVMGNLAFMVFGLAGLCAIHRHRQECILPKEYWLWAVFFAGATLVGFGSGYYHLSPSNQTLVWDRLPMTIAFMSLFAIIIMERVHSRAGLYLFPVLLICGIASVWYWNHTEMLGQGDLRPYALVQFFPMIAIILMLWLFPARYSGTRYLVYTLGWYVLAKLLEHFDKEVFALTAQLVSGHTLKHLAAAIGIYMLVLYIRKRKVISAA